ncbi:hypothetical protein TrLO_g10376 [Triparma laevis f. longispina]|uniref:Uncharacterized protein n=1 Tax=Triparma laevis f. longispina TaxID=1714387 RepID=A0A9W6ZI46_9STRA|nr:hypothetical protein TrLO_g10376 [Triparma laevis f. longispina]
MKQVLVLLLALLQALVVHGWVIPPMGCMCASGDGRLTDDYLSTLSATPDKFRATPAFYEPPVYEPDAVKKVVVEAQPLVEPFSEPARLRKRDRVKRYLEAKLKLRI